MNDTFATRGAVAHAEVQVPTDTDGSVQGGWGIVVLLSTVSIRVFNERPAKFGCRMGATEEGSLVVQNCLGDSHAAGLTCTSTCLHLDPAQTGNLRSLCPIETLVRY